MVKGYWIFVAFALGVAFGVWMHDMRIERIAIEKGLAHYDSTTGDFVWAER